MFKPENKLEELLMKSTNEPAFRPQFYKEFLNSEIFILGYCMDNKSNSFSPSDQIQIKSIILNEKNYIAIFSSLSMLQQFIKQEEKYLKIKVLDLLNLTIGAELLLNPGSEYGKEFTSDEIKRLLNGSIWTPDQSYMVKESTQVLMGQPAIYPHKLVGSLKILFKKIKGVNKGYLCHFHNPKRNEPPHSLIGIEITRGSDWNNIVSQAGIVARGVTKGIVDFIRVNKTEKERGTINYYLVNETKPFFKRGLF